MFPIRKVEKLQGAPIQRTLFARIYRSALLLMSGVSSGLSTASAIAGHVVGWGAAQPTPGLDGIVAVSAATDHSLALKEDGTIAAWGYNFSAQCDVPPGVGNSKAVVAGDYFSLALKSDGTVAAWGANDYGQCDVPSELKDVIAISAGHAHCLALKSDGTVAAWGANTFGQCDVPVGLGKVLAVLARANYSLALRDNGTVTAWGITDEGQTNVPAGLAKVKAIAGSRDYCLALKFNGTIVGWGAYPPVPAGLTNVQAIAAGENHCLALRSDGTLVAWGANRSGEGQQPAGLSGVSVIDAAWNYSVVVAASAPPTEPFVALNPTLASAVFSVSLQSRSGAQYALEYKAALSDVTWAALPSVPGNGGIITLSDPTAAAPQRFYRIRQQ